MTDHTLEKDDYDISTPGVTAQELLFSKFEGRTPLAKPYDYSAFYNDLKLKSLDVAKVDGLDGYFTVTLKNSSWPTSMQSEGFSPPLFIRSYYPHLYEVLNKCYQRKGGRRGAIISGNAGIGKSAFGMYILMSAIYIERTVYFVEAIGDKPGLAHAFKDGQYSSMSWEAVLISNKSDLLDPNVLVIFDSCSPDSMIFQAFFLVISSPKPDRWKGISKPIDVFLLPNWTMEELAALQKVAYPDKSHFVSNDVFSVAGGIPRDVFMTCASRTNSNTIDTTGLKAKLSSYLFTFLSRVDKPSLFNDLSYVRIFSSSYSHTILDIVPLGVAQSLDLRDGNYFDYGEVRPRSHFVIEGFYRKLMSKPINALSSLLNFSFTQQQERIPGVSHLLGFEFEALVNGCLSQPSSIKIPVHEIDTHKLHEIEVTNLKVCYYDFDLFCNFIKNSPSTSTFFIPRPGFTAVDSIYYDSVEKVFWFYQITIDATHDLKLQSATLARKESDGLFVHARRLNITKGTTLRLVWIVTPSVKDSFTTSTSIRGREKFHDLPEFPRNYYDIKYFYFEPSSYVDRLKKNIPSENGSVFLSDHKRLLEDVENKLSAATKRIGELEAQLKEKSLNNGKKKKYTKVKKSDEVSNK